MRALQVTDLLPDFAGCQVTETAMPEIGSNDVLVKIRAAALGFPDLLMTHGGYQHKPDLPFVPGAEFAGEVVACGDAVAGFAVGDRVVTGRLGGFAEYAACPANMVRSVPENMSYAEAAATGAAYLTAYVSLVRRGHLQAGEWLLVHGAAGGVGLAAVDLARHLGAKIIVTASSAEKLAVIQEKYAPEAALNVNDGFRQQVKEITGGGADVIYDPVGGDVFDESVRCIAWGGRLLVVGFASGRIPAITANMPLIKGFSVVGVRAGEFGRKDPQKGRENTEAIWRLAAEGAIRPHVHDIVPLAAWRDAFDAMRARQIVGRIVIDPSL